MAFLYLLTSLLRKKYYEIVKEMKMTKENEIIKSIEHEIEYKIYSEKHIYFPCINDLKNVDLKNIKDIDVYGPIKMFLSNWGIMGRVLARKKYKGWEKKLKTKISQISDKLEKFRDIQLETTNLEQWENDIEVCYKEIRNIVGPTSTSKTLHIICPSFFPLWDDNIRKLTRVSTKPVDYYNFMNKSKNFIKNNKKVITRLSKKYGKPKLKIVDEYLYNISRRLDLKEDNVLLEW